MQILQLYYYKYTFKKLSIPTLKGWGYPYIVPFLNTPLNIIPYYAMFTSFKYIMYHDFIEVTIFVDAVRRVW